MENASKALIIAGAILISILLITIGIVLINSGRDAVGTGTSGANNYIIQSFNSNFTVFEGTRKGNEIRGIWNAVRSSNATDEEHQVTIDAGNLTAGTIVPTRKYTVTLLYSETGSEATNTEKGYVYKITITAATPTE